MSLNTSYFTQYICHHIIELDDGKIETGNPDQFDGKKKHRFL